MPFLLTGDQYITTYTTARHIGTLISFIQAKSLWAVTKRTPDILADRENIIFNKTFLSKIGDKNKSSDYSFENTVMTHFLLFILAKHKRRLSFPLQWINVRGEFYTQKSLIPKC